MLRGLAYVLCRVFFRNIYISGTPYVGRSCIWCANHTSGIVDPAVMMGLAPVTLRPLSKHTLFSHPVMKPLLTAARAIPVYRMQDMKKEVAAQKEVLSKGVASNEWRSNANSDAFQAVADSLLAGDCLLIFPEGVSHDEPYLHKLRTGMARMALQAMVHNTDPNFAVILQPVAIDYFEKDEFRSDLAFHYCEPIVVTSPDMEVEDLMLGVHNSLLEGLAQFATWDEKRNWHFIFEIAYGRTPHSAREFRNFVDLKRPVFTKDPVFLARIQTMRRMMQAMNIEPFQLIWGETHDLKRSFFKLIAFHGWFHIFVSVPIMFLSGICWFVPYRLCGKLAELSTKDRDVLATMKVGHGLWIFPSWAGIFSFLLTWCYLQLFPSLPVFVAAFFGIMTGPILLVLGILCVERRDFFPGYWKLARLRLLAPRSWREVMAEWREISEGVIEMINSDGETMGFRNQLIQENSAS